MGTPDNIAPRLIRCVVKPDILKKTKLRQVEAGYPKLSVHVKCTRIISTNCSLEVIDLFYL